MHTLFQEVLRKSGSTASLSRRLQAQISMEQFMEMKHGLLQRGRISAQHDDFSGTGLLRLCVLAYIAVSPMSQSIS